MRDTALSCTFRASGRSTAFRREEDRMTTGVSQSERSKAGKKINARLLCCRRSLKGRFP
jgi:hypothetical protein